MLCKFNSRKTEYKLPFGAVASKETVRLYLEIESAVYPRDVALVIRKDGEEERRIPAEFKGMKGMLSAFEVSFEAKDSGLYFYYFTFNSNFGYQKIKKGVGGEGVINDDFDDYQLTVYDAFSETDFFEGEIFYQIFPDRFCASGEEKKGVPDDRILVSDKSKLPEFRPNEKGIVKNNDFYGGDFKGIASKLEYLKEIGVGVIYLNPIFEAHSNHRYDTADYRKPEPILGSEEDFKALADKAHSLGMKIILDGVFSHTGDDSVYFNKYNRYDSIGAYQSRGSKYFGWYNFKSWPDSYDSWWGIRIHPEVNETNEDFMNFICGKKGVLQHWMDLGADGFRLDVADELPDLFLERLYRSVKAYKSDAIVIGEVWEDASNKISYSHRRRFLLGKQLDSVMNYPFRNAIISLLKYGDREGFKETVETVLENYPQYSIKNLMNFLSTHDTKRILTALAGEEENGRGRDWMAQKVLSEDERRLGAKMLKTAYTILYMLPGNPQIYYGDEVGMDGYSDPFNRQYYTDEKDLFGIREYMKSLGKLRQSEKELFSDTKLIISTVYDGLTILLRRHNDRDIVLVVNTSNEEKNIEFLSQSTGCKKLLTTDKTAVNGMIKPMSAEVFNFSTIENVEK
ncbi:MAG: glycoside hydrolase family 13 protein [Oscillospiraceae bacterium]|nr:glycoside hydrolase family 13 protein [Oscillospiraceae bacterium]